MDIYPGMPVRLVVQSHTGEPVAHLADIELGAVADSASFGEWIAGQTELLARRARRCLALRESLSVQGEEHAQLLTGPTRTLNEARAYVFRHPNDGDLR
jgi:hypothetical protein